MYVIFLFTIAFEGFTDIGNNYKYDNIYKSYLKSSKKQLNSYFTKNIRNDTNKSSINESEDKLINNEKKFVDLNENKNNRINILVLGVEKDPRTDSILFLSFDVELKKIDIISLPRDTYYWEKGYDLPGQRKLNAVYGRNISISKDEAAKGTVKAVENILKVPIDHYICVSYKGVEEIVDTLGGVEIKVPFTMKYKDLTDKPPLIINIPKGKQTLNGKQAIKFLRWRKNNNNVGYPEGDIDRIRSQQKFIKEALKKCIGPKLPLIIKKGFDAIETDISRSDALYYGMKGIGLKLENVESFILPGVSKFKTIANQNISYFYYDKEEVSKLIEKIYKNN